MRLFFLLIAGIVLLSGCTGQSPPLTYTSDTFQISYPADWTVQESDSQIDFFAPSIPTHTLQKSLSLTSGPLSGTLDDYAAAQESIMTANLPSFIVVERKDVTVAGLPGRQLLATALVTETEQARMLFTWVRAEDTVYTIAYAAPQETFGESLLLVHEAISSFVPASQISAPAAFPTSATEDTSPAPQAPVTSTVGFAGTWRVRGQQTSRVLEILSGGVWTYGTSRGTWSVQSITDDDWVFWQAEPYGPTSKMVLDNWDSGQASGPVEYSPDVPGRVDAFWLYNEKVILQFIHTNDAI